MQSVRDYSKDKESIRKFLHNPKYTEQLVRVSNREKTDFIFELDDIVESDPEFAQAIIGNAKRYVQVFSEIIDDLLPDFRTVDNISKDTFDVFIEHRIHTQQVRQARATEGPEKQVLQSPYPAELMRRYELYFKPPVFLTPTAVRLIKAKDIGKLVALAGIVTRTSEVKPILQVATYTCDSCSAEVYQPIGGTQVKPLERCVSDECRSNRANGRLHLQTRGSKFTRFQELRIQEHSRDVPMGNIPRSITVICKGDLTRQVLPGDHVNIAGIFLPMPKAGFNAMRGGGLIADTYLEVHQISVANKVIDEDDNMSDQKFLEYIERENISIERLAISIAPEIYGHTDLKKALLCLLVGGVDQNTNGMKIRGCINICMMGDPGVAKSQLMGFIDRLAPRSQYTTGRGSSGVGLTASVMKDPVTGEFVLEGGALVLADQGICCIDEFDKMFDSDRTAIHEVMEQQTISIAKAGIMTTLNARVSILAAANPTYGRYNRKRTIEQNVNLPAALLSRFDLLWLITDVPDKENDYKLAQHIAYVHTHECQPPLSFEPLSIKVMRRYIDLAKTFNPTVPEHLTEDIVAAYINMRHEARNNQNTTYTSARCLLAIVRIATALARLRLADVVDRGDIREAIRLIECSKSSIKTDAPKTAISRSEKIYQCIHNMLGGAKTKEVEMGMAIDQCLAHGFSNDDIEEAIEEFESNNMWMVNAGRTKIIFV